MSSVTSFERCSCFYLDLTVHARRGGGGNAKFAASHHAACNLIVSAVSVNEKESRFHWTVVNISQPIQ